VVIGVASPLPGSGAILVEEDSPGVGPSGSWLGHRRNIPSWPEVVDRYLVRVVGTGCPLTRNVSTVALPVGI